MGGQVYEHVLIRYKSMREEKKQHFINKSILSKPMTSKALEKEEKKMVKNTVENRGGRRS